MVTIDLPSELEQDLRDLAEGRGQSLEEYIRLALARAIQEELTQQARLPGLDAEEGGSRP
jgi:predicted transcriptional regulator